jgi:hypothetical protein
MRNSKANLSKYFEGLSVFHVCRRAVAERKPLYSMRMTRFFDVWLRCGAEHVPHESLKCHATDSSCNRLTVLPKSREVYCNAVSPTADLSSNTPPSEGGRCPCQAVSGIKVVESDERGGSDSGCD